MATIQKTIATNVTLVNAAETAVIVTSPYVYDYPNPFVGGEHAGSGPGVSISGVINVTTIGLNATNIFVKVRQGNGVGGTIVQNYTYNVSVGAGSTYDVAYDLPDTSRWCAQTGGGIYTVTVQINNATANSTVGMASANVQGM